MRITNRMVTDTVLSNLARGQQRLETLQSHLTSGSRLTRPSDDPQGVRLALTYRTRQDSSSQYLRTIDHSLAWTEASDAALGSATDALQNARELAVRGATDTLSQDQLDGIANEADGIINQLVGLANTRFRGQYVFAGLRTDTAPAVITPGFPQTATYAGDTGRMLREIDVDETTGINITAEPLVYAINSLIGLRDNARAGNTTAMRQTSLPAIDSGLNQVLANRTQMGTTTNRLEATRDRLLLDQVNTTRQLSLVEDVDFAQAATEFAMQETVYKAALAATAKAIQPSLLDYLR